MDELFVLGDSISIDYSGFLGNMVTPYMSYNRKGKKLLKHPYDIASSDINGESSRECLDYLRKIIKTNEITADRTILLLNCGLHDIKRDTSGEINIKQEKYRENLNNIVLTCKKNCKNLYWVSSTPVDDKRHNSLSTTFFRFNEDIKIYNSIALEIMKSNNIPIIDLYLFTKSLGEDLYRDHIHFRKEISLAQAAFIAGYVIKNNYL